ncbi:uncharacterized protein TRUGW13939_05909 [Talaromyces rugulosus]|uniref:Uncharacterized protein n=1 Tax=Talaromyces rugulosus TaxID=121627 RepID=A0A7H8QXE6_TALRU|nr:uncharacterized protein TRUGW13939_05909 [Talaromyces rugulosus]QKX58782.1 hypothetical protein TRUGW13939_05909 [Talaromyces rugulosus]
MCSRSATYDHKRTDGTMTSTWIYTVPKNPSNLALTRQNLTMDLTSVDLLISDDLCGDSCTERLAISWAVILRFNTGANNFSWYIARGQAVRLA